MRYSKIKSMYRLPNTTNPLDFPDDFETLPEGLLAVGGNLHPQTLINAYAKGIFPWYSEGDPILWWHPNPRMVLFPEDIYVSTKMHKLMKKVLYPNQTNKNALSLDNPYYEVTIDQDFDSVIQECAHKRGKGREDTWIVPEVLQAYQKLFQMGYAHSVEVWNSDKKLVGGIYGVAIGKIFFGESMFSHEPNTSKIALIYLCHRLLEKGYLLLDCQVASKHLSFMGAVDISRNDFLTYLNEGETFKKQKGVF